MANQEQLEILKQGVEVWNKWRKKNPSEKIELSGADLSEIHYLSRVRLENANLERANLYQTRCTDACFNNANLKNAFFEGANLFLADLAKANLETANLSNADLHGSNLDEANLDHAILNKANLRESSLEKTSFRYASLNDVDFMQARFNRTNLSNVHLVNTNFFQTGLTQSNLSNAYLLETKFIDTTLYKTRFSRATFSSTTFSSCDLSTVIGLEKAVHNGPTYLDMKTIQISKGKIPENFLRGCGLSDLDIEYAKLAATDLDTEQVTDITYKIHQLYLGGGIKYYSCFISYSSKDQDFAQCLHDDLQNNGVRCWFDREDLKIGDSIRPTIDRQIRLRDKLLVILSENSIKSEWVGDEVEGAFEEEQKGNRSVLFPIRLDGTVLNARDDWAAKIKRRRHIGDFSNWQDKVSYQKAFERLLRDLKAAG